MQNWGKSNIKSQGNIEILSEMWINRWWRYTIKFDASCCREKTDLLMRPKLVNQPGILVAGIFRVKLSFGADPFKTSKTETDISLFTRLINGKNTLLKRTGNCDAA